MTAFMHEAFHGMASDSAKSREQLLQAYREWLIKQYSKLWRDMLAAWLQSDAEDRIWFIYAHGYLLRTDNTRWAIDPNTLRHRLSQAEQVDLTALKQLSFVVLTHNHAAHVDAELITALRASPVKWVIPEHMVDSVVERCGLRRKQIVVPGYHEAVTIDGVKITAFPGVHGERSAPGAPPSDRLPSTGYLFQIGERRLLYPGDTRTYDSSLFPALAGVDTLLAHLWLGRKQAVNPAPPELQAFVRFVLDFQPRRVILGHLYEVGRKADDCWVGFHADLVRASLREQAPSLPVTAPAIGQDCVLWP